MGLDMYMFRVSKLSEQEALELIGVHTDKISGQYHYVHKSDFDDDPEPYSDLIPFLTQVPAVTTAFNYQKCFEHYGINCHGDCCDITAMFEGDVDIAENVDKVVGSHFGPNGAGWSFASGKSIELTRDEYDSYLYDTAVDLYIWKSEDVAYWRKFYDLDEFLQQLRIACRAKRIVDEEGRVPEVDEVKSWVTENCGYYQLSHEEKQAIKIFLADNEAPYSANCKDGFLDDDSAIMYHAWW